MRISPNLSILNRVKMKSYFYSMTVPLILVLINFVLKIRFLSWPSLAMDEPFSVYYSQFSISTIIYELSLGNNPPLYEIFLHFWVNIFGISEFAVRLPSVLFSSLAVYFIYRICYKYFDVKTAILASILFTFSNYQLYFAQEARVYPLFMLLSIVSMDQFMRLVTPGHSKSNSITYVIVSILLLYSHFFSWFILFVQAFVLIIIHGKKPSDLLRFTKYYIVIFLCYLPYVKVFIGRFLDSSKGTWIEPVHDLRPLHNFYNSLLNENHTAYVIALVLCLVLLLKYIVHYFSSKYVKVALINLSIIFFVISLSFRLPAVFTFIIPQNLLPLENNFLKPIFIISFLMFYVVMFIHFLSNKNRSKYEKIVLASFFIPCIVMFSSSFTIPMFIDRYLIYCTPAFFIILSLIVTKLDNKLSLSFSLMIITLMIVSFSPLRDNYRDVKTLVAKVKEMQQDSNSAVFICPEHFGFTITYYYDRDYFTNTENNIPQNHMLDGLRSDNVFLVKDFKELDSICKINDYDKIIYVDADADFSHSNNNINNYLSTKFQGKSVSFDSTHVREIFNIYSYKILD